jgi:dipeptidyl aminopeptidase/acylaminoacyl peptidase
MIRISLKSRITKWSLLSLVLAPLVSAATAPNNPAKLTLEDLIDATGLSSVSLSPDGGKFAITRDGQIDLVPSTGGWPVQLTTSTGGKQGAKWSPDGSTIAFVSAGSIWTVPSAGGQPVRLTDNRPGPGDPRTSADRTPQWSPDSKWILYETGRSGFAGLAVVSKEGLSSNYLTNAQADDESAAWSPDGKSIAYIERSPKYFSGQLFVANFDSNTGRFTSEPKALYTAETDRGGGWSIRPPVWSPDGKSLAIILQDTGWNKIYLLPSAGGEPRAITNGESEDGDPVFSPDGKRLAFVSNREKPEEQHIWVAGADGAQPHRLSTPSAGIDADPIWSSDSRQIYFLHTSSFEPSSLVATSIDGGPAKTIIRTQPVSFANIGLPQPEAVHYKSKDGRDVSAILYKPLDYAPGKQYPAVLWIHGGPEGQDTLTFDPWDLYLAQNGYVVLTPNYRGSTGYGEKFRNLNVEDSGGGEVDDVAAGAQYLVSQGLADKNRIGIGGGSHGGTMVAYEVTKQPDLWHAAIELYGVVDRASFIDRTNRPSAIRWTAKMGGTPAEKADVYKKANILPDVPKISSPLLIMHGENDPQVPPYESQLFTAALKKAGKPYLYYTYPNELHGFSQRDHRLDAWRKQVAFLNYYLKPETGRSITSTQDIVLDEADIK